MTVAPHNPPRRGVTAVECAFVLPITFFLILSIVVGAMGVFRYQEVSSLAREGARYSSTHGYLYRKEAGLPDGTAADWKQDIYDNAIAPNFVAIDPARLTVEVAWPDVVNQPGKPDNWPGSKVDVTVRYQWLPEIFLVGPIYLESKSSMPITN